MPADELTGLISRRVPVATGIALHVVERPGRGTPVICLHGIWGSWRRWRPLLAPGPGSFAGRPLLMVDLRGHGRSDKPETGYALRDYAADIVALLDALDAQRVTLIGHSLGALMSIVVVQTVPGRIETMVLEEPPLPLPTDLMNLGPFWASFAEALLGLFAIKHQPHSAVVAQLLEWAPDLTREQAEEYATSVIETADGVFAAITAGAFGGDELTAPSPPLPIPTLVFQGALPEQRGLQDEGVALLRARFPLLRLEVIPETGHSILDIAPEAYRAAIATFLGA